jgi:hypothetical protein
MKKHALYEAARAQKPMVAANEARVKVLANQTL